MENIKKENDNANVNNENIIEKIQKCVCLILNKKTLGLFCKFPLFGNSKIFKGLLINCDNIDEKNEYSLTLKLNLFNNNNYSDHFNFIYPIRDIILDDTRTIHKFFFPRIMLIEIKESDDIPDFLDIDFNINEEENYLKSIEYEQLLFTFNGKEGIDFSLTYGLFSENDQSLFVFPIENDCENKGCPILSSKSFKVVGIHCGYTESLSKGTFFKVKKNKNISEKYKEIKTIKNNDKNNEICIKYKIEDDKNKIKLFGENFVVNNKENFKIIIEDKEQDLCPELDITENMRNKKSLEIKLRQYNLVYNINNMFEGCKELISLSELSNLNTTEVINMENLFFDCISLTSLPNISNWFTKNVISMRGMFNGCSSLTSIPDISLWDTSNLIDISCLFSFCSALSSLPDISKWDTRNLKSIRGIFEGCSALKSMPDISTWDISQVTDLSFIFSSCSSLPLLPDISKWNTSNVKNMDQIFNHCRALQSLPDISKWNMNNVTSVNLMFNHCESLSTLPDISKWNVSNIKNMGFLFSSCYSLLSLPDISKWKTKNVCNMEFLFFKCTSLKTLPDISQWDVSQVKQTTNFFSGCSSLIYLPDISKWNTCNFEDMKGFFDGCTSLLYLPDISKWNTKNVKNMSYMFGDTSFGGCSSLLYLPDISKWNVENVLYMNFMFYGCTSLVRLPDISKWKINPNSNYDEKNLINECVNCLNASKLQEN